MRILYPISFLFLLTFSFTSFGQYTNQRVVGSNYEFEEGSREHLYGDKVVLRDAASSAGKALDTLSIGSEVVIVKRTNETASLSGLDWNWYKVKVGRKTGFILGGLIALDQVKFENVTYLVTMAGVDKSQDDWEYLDYRVRTRVLKSDGEFYGHESKLNTNSFYIEAFDDRGMEGIENMLVINLFAESCGTDGGEIYLFNDGKRVFTAISLSRVSEAGLFWFEERVIFPNDEKGSHDGMVRYEREHSENLDEELNWNRSTIHSLNLAWIDGRFMPNIDEFEFNEDN